MAAPVAIVTGASRGIGRATALALRQAGHEVMLVARTPGELEAAAREAGGTAIRADVTVPGDVDRVISETLERFGRIDVLVNNAGLAPRISIDEMSIEQWRAVIDTNLSAAVYLARACWPGFRRQGGGVIVNISSVSSRDPFPGLAAYGAAKAGLNLFGLALAREGEPINVRVHTIAPGSVETAMFRQLATHQQWPTHKTLDPADVARVVLQCVAGELRHTSGEVIFLHKTL